MPRRRSGGSAEWPIRAPDRSVLNEHLTAIAIFDAWSEETAKSSLRAVRADRPPLRAMSCSGGTAIRRPEVSMMLERILDLLGAELGLDAYLADLESHFWQVTETWKAGAAADLPRTRCAQLGGAGRR
jgi:hypothetical protein